MATSRIYWDTSVFLCLLSEEEVARRLICEDILRHAQDGKVTIVTSMFTVVEVIRPKAIKFPVPLTDEQVTLLEGMFKWPWISKIQVHEELAKKASRLARTHGLKPADAIHAATAIDERVDQLQKWDRDFDKVSGLIVVTEPALLSPPNLFTVSLPESSIDAQPPSEQSHDADQPSTSQPAPDLREAPQAVQEQPRPGSSPGETPPAPSEQ